MEGREGLLYFAYVFIESFLAKLYTLQETLWKN